MGREKKKKSSKAIRKGKKIHARKYGERTGSQLKKVGN
jgi:hypothetical protein